MKTCSKCKVEKEETNFSKSKDRPDGLDSYCKQCKSLISSERYKNSPTLSKYIKKYQFEKNLKNRQYVRAYLLQNPCVDCKEPDPIVLEFDHKDTENKLLNISVLLTRSCTFEKLEAEIKKCDVRCANCHRRRTAIQFNWYASLDGYQI